MSDSVVIATLDDARALERRVRASATRACATLSDLLSGEPPLEVFRAMKFRRVGFVPTDAERPNNRTGVETGAMTGQSINRPGYEPACSDRRTIWPLLAGRADGANGHCDSFNSGPAAGPAA